MLVRISVRNLIEFVMRSGDIDNSFRNNARMIEGIRAHQKIQNSYGKNYKKEYFLKNTTLIEDVEFKVEGRADGLIKDHNKYTIDEIKSTTRSLDEIDDSNKLHWAQAMCYAYFYCVDKDLHNIFITLTYVNIEDYSSKIFKKEFDFESLQSFYSNLLESYLKFSKILADNKIIRDKSIRELDFPYNSYRNGQRKLAVAVYTSVMKENNLFVDAPTGIGKTISTVFPSIKSMGEDLSDKIFYLTSKNTQSKEAIKSIRILKDKGLFIKALAITSKEKICLNDEVKCNPIDCPFAKGHFDRVNDALLEIISKEEIIDFNIITFYAEKYRVCPFEFELDISNYADFVVCDYNYVFNPTTYLKRFFDEIVDRYIFLIDEAHNLLDRSRDMYSFRFRKNRFSILIEKLDSKNCKTIIKYLDQIIEKFYDLYASYGKKLFYYQEKIIDDFDDILIKLLKPIQKYLIENKEDDNYEDLLNLYFDINKYLKISDYYTEGFYSILAYDENYDDIYFEIKCVDPAQVLKNTYSFARTSVFFSATLLPMDYFVRMLGANDALRLKLDMPFANNNYDIYVREISTRYRDRNSNVTIISDSINEFVKSKVGNYFIFFPSYSYMMDVYEDFSSRYDDKILLQDRFMNEKDVSKFLGKFDKDSNKTAFLVLGGIFSEGVDLIGDRLIGAMIISVGMPGVSYERNLIKEHFDKIGLNGFDYSYTYPGINKIFQAAGRVIRSEEDRGIIYLIDDRFTSYKYRMLYPKHWKNKNIKIVNDSKTFNKEVKSFWEELGEKSKDK